MKPSEIADFDEKETKSSTTLFVGFYILLRGETNGSMLTASATWL